jgi:hypothetical protein
LARDIRSVSKHQMEVLCAALNYVKLGWSPF